MVSAVLVTTLALEMLLLLEPQVEFLKVLVVQEAGLVLVMAQLAQHLEVEVLLVVIMEVLEYLAVVVEPL